MYTVCTNSYTIDGSYTDIDMVKKLLTIRIDEDKREEFIDKARVKGTSASELVNTWIDKYLDDKLDGFDDTIPVETLESRIDNYLDSKLDSHEKSMEIENLDTKIDNYLDSHLDTKIDNYLDGYLDTKIDNYLDSHLDTKIDNYLDGYLGTKIDNYLDNKLNARVNELISNAVNNQPSITMADVEEVIANNTATLSATLEQKLGGTLLEETRYQLHNTVNKKIQSAIAGLSFPTLTDVEKAIASSTITITATLSDTVDKRYKEVNDAIASLPFLTRDDISEMISIKIAEADQHDLHIDETVSNSSDVQASLSEPAGEISSTPDNEKIEKASSEKTVTAVFPDGLSQAELGRRLSKTSSTVAKSWNKGKAYFKAWSKKYDPDGIAWELRSTRKKGKYYFPCVD